MKTRWSTCSCSRAPVEKPPSPNPPPRFAGYDAHYQDPLEHLQFQPGTYYALAAAARALAAELCGGRLLLVLEGGCAPPPPLLVLLGGRLAAALPGLHALSVCLACGYSSAPTALAAPPASEQVQPGGAGRVRGRDVPHAAGPPLR